MTNSINTPGSRSDSEFEAQSPPPSVVGYRSWIESGGADELLASRDIPASSRTLAESEAALIADVVNGGFHTREQDFYISMVDSIHYEYLDEKWGVDKDVLLDTFRCCRTVDVVALIAGGVRWLSGDSKSLAERYETSGFSTLLVPTQPVPGEVMKFGNSLDTLNRIDLAANGGSFREEELIGFLQHQNPRVRQHAIHRLGGDGVPDVFDKAVSKP